MLMFSSGVAGLGAASAQITALQQALLALSQASGKPAINPGPIDGILSNQTMMAVAAGLQTAAAKIPQDTVMKIVSAALALGATTTQAKTTVTNYAVSITTVIKAATVAYATGLVKGSTGTAVLPPPVVIDPANIDWGTAKPASAITSFLTPTASTPWYKQWWGIALIAVGALGAYKLLTAPKPTASS